MNRVLFTLLLVITLAISASAWKIEPNGFGQEALYNLFSRIVERDNARTLSYANFHNSAAGSATWDVGTTFSYVINGLMYSKTASDTVAGISAAAQATGTACMYTFTVDTSGNVAATKGTAVAYDKTPLMPTLAASLAPFAAIKVVILPDATAGYTLGTSAFNYDASTTITIYHLANDKTLSLTDF